MSKPDLKPTACNICYANCGILVETEGRDIVENRVPQSFETPRH